MTRRISISFILCVLTISSAFSLPRFASRTGYACQNCHVNPSGGGMRNAFGVTYGRDEITIKEWQEEYSLSEFLTRINNFISYGVDFRFLTFYQKKDNPDATKSSFFPMQADVYFNFAVSKKINIFANPAFGPYNRYEIFATAKILPWNGYLKLGRFTPPYGLRIDDHTSYVRDITPFRNNSGQQSGIEIGFNPGSFSLLGAVTNGMVGDRDGDLAKAVFGRAEGRFTLGPANVMLGISSYNDVSNGEKYNMLGGFGAFSLDESLTIVGDIEKIEGNASYMGINSDRNQRNSQSQNLKQLAVMVEASYPLTQGFDLKFMYDFFDPNTDTKTGSTIRYSGGFEFMPFGGVEVRPLYRYTKDTILNRNTTDIHVLFHFYL